MSVQDPISTACSFIERNLTEEIGYADVARVVAFSPFHFHRLFSAVVGESITEYIRRRRLTEAARQLVATRYRIIDIAIGCRFESQASFTKAFRRQYGITPGAYRRRGVHLTVTQNQNIQQLEHGIRQEPRIVELPERLIVGMQYVGKNQNGEIPQVWGAFNPRACEVPHRILPAQSIGYCEIIDNPKEEGEFSYICGVFVGQIGELPPGMVARTIPAQTYVVFTHEGSADALGKSYEYIWRTWMPASQYEAVMTHDYELYDERFDARSATWVLDLYVPVRPRS
ncbi:MAG TPA: AraC family transcriptional regulator [Symbiobacteriaceae bacterium]|nr:AraC family transcriptional regulator [Symbiobacteriaceae bacterium]